VQAPCEKWLYAPCDGANVRGSLSGPAREAVEKFDRVLAYGRWGSEVLATIRRPLLWLPHGLDLDAWDYRQDGARLDRMRNLLRLRDGEILVGGVMANQPRKDWGVAVQTISELRRRGWRVRAWWHTDALIKSHAWNLAQLIADHGLEKAVVVTSGLTDADLAACYSLCGVTILPTKGDGVGFPILESLACGTPCVTTDCAGGAELVPVNAWRVPVRTWQIEASFYGLQRPVVAAEDVANAVERALAFKRAEERLCQAYCRAQVEYLSWPTLWPRWRSWFRQGLEAV
jgi:glycosyltransferase involved in cell wall biosynthesis